MNEAISLFRYCFDEGANDYFKAFVELAEAVNELKLLRALGKNRQKDC